MGVIRVSYEFEDQAGQRKTFEITYDEATLRLQPPADAPAPPEWARLETQKCPHCPLDAAEHPYCPVAAAMAPVLDFSNDYKSFDNLCVRVKTDEREIVAHAPAQVLFGSMIGLMTATSGCPYTAYFKPMARFHLPFATVEETIYRVFAMYLLAQYFRQKDGETADFDLDGLKRIYEDIEIVNLNMTQRLRLACRTDASLNAVIVLDTFAKTMLAVIDEQIEEIRPLFAPYLKA